MKKILLSVVTAWGVMSAHGALYEYSVALDGPSEPSPSLGVGSGTVIYDDANHFLQLQVVFSGLTTTTGTGTSVSHIHAATLNPFTGTAGVAVQPGTLTGFPAGVFSGSYSNTLDLTLAANYTGAFLTANGGTAAGAEAGLAAAMASGRAYWNIHSQAFPGGEIRGFLVAVPEPSSLALLGLGFIGIAVRVWSKRRVDKF